MNALAVPATHPVADHPRPKLISIKAVAERVGLSRSSIYRLVAEDAFPRPVKVSERRVTWLEHEVDAFIAARIAARATKGERHA